jgi:uncharacterized membrane protein
MDEGDASEPTAANRTGPIGPKRYEDNSVGRLLALSDGVFAIAMTLLALDLKVPDVGSHPSDAHLRHALAANSDSYLAFLVSFYVIAATWGRHRRLLRSVIALNSTVVRDTLLLLLTVTVVPFAASLLGEYGSTPISLVVYGSVSIVSTLTLMLLSRDLRRGGLLDPLGPSPADYTHSWNSWWTLAVFVLCLPAGYVLGSHGPWVLVLLAVPTRLTHIRRLVRR